MAPKKKTEKAKSSQRRLGKKTAVGRRSTRKASGKKVTSKKKPRTRLRKTRKQGREDLLFKQRSVQPRSGTQSGDLQGLRDTEDADSESVDELLEEGNAFEAGVVAGVEEADDDQTREVHTHEVPEDDVPEEYWEGDS